MSVLKPAFGFALALAILAGEARAQVPIPAPPVPTPVQAPVPTPAQVQLVRPGPAPRVPWLPHGLAPSEGTVPAYSVSPGYMPTPAGAPPRPYSYYAVPPFQPARYYQGYGTSDFPFYGQAYGRVYDRWTWPYMSIPPNPLLYRYYYPPLS